MQNAAEKNSQPLRVVELPFVEANTETLRGYGEIVTDPHEHAVEIVAWPVQGWRQLDPGTGNEGGTTEGVFEFWWTGDVLRGRNNAVDDQYVLGWTCDPSHASDAAQTCERERVLLSHANYHPDGGQLFYPLDKGSFVVPLALPGDDIKPEDFVAFRFDGSCGLYMHPGVWHEAVFPRGDRARFFDKQGKVHARISCNFDQEFGVYLSASLSE